MMLLLFPILVLHCRRDSEGNGTWFISHGNVLSLVPHGTMSVKDDALPVKNYSYAAVEPSSTAGTGPYSSVDRIRTSYGARVPRQTGRFVETTRRGSLAAGRVTFTSYVSES